MYLHYNIYLDDQSDGLHAPERVAVERVEAVVPHDGRLQDIATLAVEHEQGLVHLHGLI